MRKSILTFALVLGLLAGASETLAKDIGVEPEQGKFILFVSGQYNLTPYPHPPQFESYGHVRVRHSGGIVYQGFLDHNGYARIAFPERLENRNYLVEVMTYNQTYGWLMTYGYKLIRAGEIPNDATHFKALVITSAY